MEDEHSLPSGIGIESLDQYQRERRHDAIASFVQKPELSAQQYPDLVESLCIFFQQSTNPYLTEEGPPRNELLCNQWEKAKRWANEYLAGSPEKDF